MRRPSPWPWREHLTAEERPTIEAAEQAQATWQRLKQPRADIISRATARARAAGAAPSKDHPDD